jgi:hypothetical protein
MSDRGIQALADATRRRRETAEQAVQKAIRQAGKTGGPVSVAAIARTAGVSTDFIYRHPGLRPQAEALRRPRQPASATAPDAAAAESTLIRRLTQQLADQRRKHREETAELRAALETAHGELLSLRRQLSR